MEAHTHTHKYALLANTHTHPCFPCTNCHSALLLLLRHFPLLDCSSTPHFKFPQSRHVQHGIAAQRRFSSAVDERPTRVHSRYQLLSRRHRCRRVPSISTRPLPSFILFPLSLGGFSRKPNAVNEPWSWHLWESSNYINVSDGDIPKCLPRHLPPPKENT